MYHQNAVIKSTLSIGTFLSITKFEYQLTACTIGWRFELTKRNHPKRCAPETANAQPMCKLHCAAYPKQATTQANTKFVRFCPCDAVCLVAAVDQNWSTHTHTHTMLRNVANISRCPSTELIIKTKIVVVLRNLIQIGVYEWVVAVRGYCV